MSEKLKVRNKDGAESVLTAEQYARLSAQERAELQVQLDGEWIRVARFGSDGSDIEVS